MVMMIRSLVFLLLTVAPGAAFSVSDRRAFLQTAAGAALISVPPPAKAVKVGGTIRLGDERWVSFVRVLFGMSNYAVSTSIACRCLQHHGAKSTWNLSFASAVRSSLWSQREVGGQDMQLQSAFCGNGRLLQSTNFEDAVLDANGPITFYDSVTGKPLFVAPIDRSPEQFIQESKVHGWPSFRDQEVVWENVRVLKNSGETVSVDGTHLGT